MNGGELSETLAMSMAHHRGDSFAIYISNFARLRLKVPAFFAWIVYTAGGGGGVAEVIASDTTHYMHE